MGAAEWVCGAVRQLQQRLGSSTDADELRRSLRLLSRLPMTPEILAATGVRGTLEALSKHQQVGSVAKELAERWEILAVPSHASEARSQVPERAVALEPTGEDLGQGERNGAQEREMGKASTADQCCPSGARDPLQAGSQERLASSTEGDALRKILRLLSVLPITAEILAATGEMAKRWKTLVLLGGHPALEAELMGRGPERDGAPAPSQEVLESQERKQKRERWSLAGKDPSSQSRAEEPRGPGYQAAEGAWGAARQLQEHLARSTDTEEIRKTLRLLSILPFMPEILESRAKEPCGPGTQVVEGPWGAARQLQEHLARSRDMEEIWKTLRLLSILPFMPEILEATGEVCVLPSHSAAGGAWTPRVLFELVPEPRPAARHPSPGNGHSRTMAPGGTDRLWQVRCRKEFKEATPAPGESWQELFVRLRQEREQRLQAVSARIRAAQAQESGGRRAQMLLHPLPQKRPRRGAQPRACSTGPAPHQGGAQYMGYCNHLCTVLEKQHGGIYKFIVSPPVWLQAVYSLGNFLGAETRIVPPANILQVLDVGDSKLLLGYTYQSSSYNTYSVLALGRRRTLSEADVENFQNVLQGKDIGKEPVYFTGHGSHIHMVLMLIVTTNTF
ncbi:elongin-A3-like [Perognathus longimembris pacificus]|uniref:elongin-A3-like n=1 Tax=Perognathus longimembris pacificus TaxID=214514 RepID=UPI00201A230B|nr:elongin-A3-like [Perognathus longimembris pacificus]